ncbi:unnamed protein product [Miscanthus lutarioriparius]|uniref:Uncharacterized protein n=1 Tax=Miscanthus lutarioriparius TaxID=422564 RepID=A0A811QG33_9POAL|nr:unnamed protein product [Miscanthus lutarioriparius]
MVGMEAAAVSAMLKLVGNKLAPLVFKEYSYIVGVKEDLRELQDLAQEINSRLEAAGDRAIGDAPFLKKLKEAVYEVDDVVDEFQLKAEKYEADVVGNDPVSHIEDTAMNMQTLPFVDEAAVIGRDQEMNDILSELLQDVDQQRIKIVSIVGLGGSGKTTLAQLVFSEVKNKNHNHFPVKLWVHVSEEKFQLEKILKKLFDAISNERSDGLSLRYMANKISDELTNKRFLLVLDDVWTQERIKWAEFMVHLKNGSPGSRILLTTRSRNVAEAVESTTLIDLPLLSKDYSWQVFQQSFGNAVKDLGSEFQEVGKDTVNKCGGVPLAIKVLAGILRDKKRVEQWHAIKDNNLLDVDDKECQLTRLETLGLFVIGEDNENDAQTSELENINKIRGELTIHGIGHCIDLDVAHKELLKQKTNLQSLTLTCASDVGAKSKNQLEGLEPPPGIDNLKIVGYSGQESMQWMLKHRDFPKLERLEGLTELPYLEKLVLRKMTALRSISGGPFPSLLELYMNGMPSLGVVWMVTEESLADVEGGQLQIGNRLSFLTISECPKLMVMPYFPSSLKDLHLVKSNVQLLGLPGVDQRSSLPSSSAGLPSFSFSRLKELVLEGMAPPAGAASYGSGCRWELLQHLIALESLRIDSCNGLTELPESMRSLASLRTLRIIRCRPLCMLPEWLGSSVIWKRCSELELLRRSRGSSIDDEGHNAQPPSAEVSLLAQLEARVYIPLETPLLSKSRLRRPNEIFGASLSCHKTVWGEAYEELEPMDVRKFSRIFYSWQLFQQSFGNAMKDLDSEFQEVGKEIVNKCVGVPLAIKVLAGVLRVKKRLEQWQAIKESNLLDVEGRERQVSACLWLSYFNMPFHLKQCFTICSIFPKGYWIDKDQLIDQWISLDMVMEDVVKDLEIIGNDYFNQLVQMYFIQDVKERNGEKVKYDDFIFGKSLKKAKHLRSITVENVHTSALTAILQTKNLRYLSISGLRYEPLPEVISEIWSLQALHVTSSNLVKLPESIGKLQKLIVVNLSYCWHLTSLPDSIGTCVMISSIDLFGCKKVATLPSSISRNKRLRDVESYEDSKGIGQLTRLETLGLFVMGEDDENYAHISELENINKISRELTIHGIRHCMDPDVAHKECLKQKTNLQSLTLICASDVGVNSESHLDGLEPPPGIGNLKIVRYSGQESPQWMRMFRFRLLCEMELSDFPKLERLEGLPEFPCLEKLMLSGMPALKSISGGPFPSLLKLFIMGGMPSLGVVWMVTEGGMADVEGGQVQIGAASYGSGCRWELLQHLTALESLAIRLCDGLIELPESMRSIASLRTLRISFCSSLCMLPEWLGELRYLETMSFFDCSSLSPAPSMQPLRALKALDISNSRWVDDLCSPSLQTLVIHICDGISSHTQSFRQLTSLTDLQILGCRDFHQLPECLGELCSLQKLDIRGLPRLSSLPQSLGHLTSLQELRIEYCDALAQLPECVGELHSLRIFKIWQLRSLRCLPQSLGHLTSLQELKITYCEALGQLPESLGELRSLRVLTISQSHSLTCLPQSLGHLTSLQKLGIAYCRELGQLPKSLGGLRSLSKLVLWWLPGLTSVPESMCCLTSLEELTIMDCPGI